MTDMLAGTDPNIIANKIKALEARLAALEQRKIEVEALSDISDDMGDQRAGRFLALSSGEQPTDPDATGSYMSSQGEEFPDGNTYHVGGVKQGRPQWGANSENGSMMYGGKRGFMDEDGQRIVGIAPKALKFEAGYSHVSIGHTAYTLHDYKLIHTQWYADDMSPLASLINDYYHGWTMTGDGVTDWEITTDNSKAGGSCARFVHPGGDQSAAAPKLEYTFTPTGLILLMGSVLYESNWSTLVDIGMSASNYGLRVYVQFYDAGDDLLGYEYILTIAPDDNIPVWTDFHRLLQKPANATSAKLIVETNEDVEEAYTIQFEAFLAIPCSSGSQVELGEPNTHYVVPKIAEFTWVNMTTANAIDSEGDGGIYMTAPALAAASLRVLKQAAPDLSWWTRQVWITPMLHAGNYNAAGICWRQSSDGKLITVGLRYNGSWGIAVDKWTNPTTGSSAVSHTPIYPVSPICIKIEDNNTLRKAYWSADGLNWEQIYSEARTTFLTGDEVGIYVNSQHATYGASALFMDWE
jgi:hypothetical protein